MTGRAHLVRAVLQVDAQVDRRREALVPVLAQQVVVGGSEEPGRRKGIEQAGQRPGELERAGAGLGALAQTSTTTSCSVSRPCVDTTKSPLNGVLPAARIAVSRYQPAGRLMLLGRWMRSRRSTNIASAFAPPTPRRVRRNETRQISSAIRTITIDRMTRRREKLASRRATTRARTTR